MSRAAASSTYGSLASTLSPKPCARAATALPICPMPTSPSVWPRSRRSTGILLKSQAPSLAMRPAGNNPRAQASSIAMVWSATSSMQYSVVLATMIPHRVAASTSTLS